MILNQQTKVMKYEHATIKVTSPAPGHYIISGHAPATNSGVHGILEECYITPEVPTEILEQVLAERKEVEEKRANEAAEQEEHDRKAAARVNASAPDKEHVKKHKAKGAGK